MRHHLRFGLTVNWWIQSRVSCIAVAADCILETGTAAVATQQYQRAKLQAHEPSKCRLCFTGFKQELLQSDICSHAMPCTRNGPLATTTWRQAAFACQCNRCGFSGTAVHRGCCEVACLRVAAHQSTRCWRRLRSLSRTVEPTMQATLKPPKPTRC
jgi:hypothetical protein